MEKIKLLLVEDEHTLADIIRDTLNEKGFEVYVAYNGLEGLRVFEQCHPHVVVTDIMMPQMDGLTMVKQLRAKDESLPVLFLSARSGAQDVVEGFEIGGNDYIRKPFAMSELIVRIKALLGRSWNKSEATESEAVQTRFQLGCFLFDATKGTLNDCVLTTRESEILHLLCLQRGQVVPIHTFLMQLWGSDTYFNNRSLNVFISRLRHRLSSDPSLSIVNVRGVGYRLLY